jgi:uncharacterized protein (TIRG00374 family)
MAGAPPQPAKRRSRRWRAARLILGLGALALGVHLVAAQFAGLTATGEQLAAARWWLPVLVLVLEAASLLAYGELILTVLRPSGVPVPRNLVQRCVVAGLALGRALPGGNAAAMAVSVSALRRSGVPRVVATTGLATSGLLSSVVLAGLLPIGVGLTWATGHVGGIAVSAFAAAGAVLVAAALVPVAARRPDALAARVARVVAAVARGPLRGRISPSGVAGVVRRGAEGIRKLARDRVTLVVSAAWAAANWLLDAGVVVALASTIGRGTPLLPILLAYVIAQLAAAVPLTPGGVGIVETAMIGFLVTAGAPAAAATTTVLGWRLVSHWLPILVGLVLLPTVNHRRTPGRPRD